MCLINHWSQVTHIRVGTLTIIGSDNGLGPTRRQAIIWTNAWVLLIEQLGTNVSEIIIEIITFSFAKMRLRVSSAKRRPFCLGRNVLMHCGICEMDLLITVDNDRLRNLWCFEIGCITLWGDRTVLCNNDLYTIGMQDRNTMLWNFNSILNVAYHFLRPSIKGNVIQYYRNNWRNVTIRYANTFECKCSCYFNLIWTQWWQHLCPCFGSHPILPVLPTTLSE